MAEVLSLREDLQFYSTHLFLHFLVDHYFPLDLLTVFYLHLSLLYDVEELCLVFVLGVYVVLAR